MKWLRTALLLILATSALNAQAAVISILRDVTSAHALVRFNPDPVLDPGTTVETFRGPLFPGGAFFGGASMDVIRSADIPFDTVGYSASNRISDGPWGFQSDISIGPAITVGTFGATGAAEAQTDMDLKFTVSGSDGVLNMAAVREGAVDLYMRLFDQTINALVVETASNFGPNLESVALIDGHTYVMTGHLYGYTDFSGDPAGVIGFDFENSTLQTVPAPPVAALLLLGIAVTLRSRHNRGVVSNAI